MHYITGIHALNLPCSLDTCGDWHQSAMKWEDITFADSENSIYGGYGIESGYVIPCHEGTFYVANHIRALLDLLANGYFSVAQGMNESFIGNDKYNSEIFDRVAEMHQLPHWPQINIFMGKEYKMKWLKYLLDKGYDLPIQSSQQNDFMSFKGDSVHDINAFAVKKATAYGMHDNIADLADVAFLCEHSWGILNDAVKELIRSTIEYKGTDHYQYLLATQKHPLVDADVLNDNIAKMYARLCLF